MKTTVGVIFVLFLASNLQAQGRRPTTANVDSVTIGGNIFDATDPFAFWRAQPVPANSPSSAAEPIPVSQLRIPSKALKEFERSQKALRSGDLHTSVDHLQKALQIYPDFVQAHNALGLRFAQLGEYQKALTEHQAALSLDPHRADTHQNLSFALLLLNRAKEAEAEARESLDLDSRPVSARYLLGRAVIAQGRVTSEGIEMLRQSEDTFPDASLVLAQVQFRLGHTDQVVAELRHYLRAPSDLDNKQKAQCWLAQLSQQPAPAGCPVDSTPPSFR